MFVLGTPPWTGRVGQHHTLMHVTEVQIRTVDDVVLQGRHRPSSAPTRGSALLCHPHPAFGGHMDVWLLPAIAERLAADGWDTLRLNFRGVGGSGGQQTGGREEHLDAEAGVAWLRGLQPDLPVAAVGWSFGALIALRLGSSVDAWVGIGPPTRPLADVPMTGPLVPDELPSRRTVIVGEHDQFFPPATTGVLDPDHVRVVDGADHFMFDRDPEVAVLVAAALAPRVGAA